MLAVHQPLQLLAIQLTRQPQRPSSLTDPPARRLALTGVVVLTALRDLLLVIQLLRAAHPNLADRQHDPSLPPSAAAHPDALGPRPLDAERSRGGVQAHRPAREPSTVTGVLDGA